jgi:hypothetical protein
VSAMAPPITPEKQSLLGGGASGPGIRRPPPVLQNRVVLARTQPPPAAVPFALQQDAMRANGGRPLARSEMVAMQILAPALHVRVAAATARGEPRTGLARAAVRVSPVPAGSAVPPAPRATARSALPLQGSDPRRAQPTNVSAAPLTQAGHFQVNDRPRASASQAGPVAAEPQMSHRVDRPVAAVRTVPVPTPPYIPPPAEVPPVAAAPPAKPAKSAAHAAKPAPVERGRK